MLAEFLLVLTFIFYLIIQFTIKKINFLLALLIPVMSCLVAFCIGIFILMLTRLSGIPRQYILIYGLVYGLITLLATYWFWGREKTINKN